MRETERVSRSRLCVSAVEESIGISEKRVCHEGGIFIFEEGYKQDTFVNSGREIKLKHRSMDNANNILYVILFVSCEALSSRISLHENVFVILVKCFKFWKYKKC